MINNSQLKLLFILIIFTFPFIISYFILDDYNSGQDLQTTNYGEFIDPPINIKSINTPVFDKEEDPEDVFNKKWTLIQFERNICSKRCSDTTFLLKQINIALGKDMKRIQRVFLSYNKMESIGISTMIDNYPNLILINNEPRDLHIMINKISNNESAVLLVDPLGNVILKYRDDFNGKKLLKDLKKLLKLSRVG